MEEKESDIKKVQEVLPIVSAWSLIFSSVGIYSYYIHFNLNIFKYIDITELILLSLPEFAITLVIMILFVFVSVLHPFQNMFDETSDSLDAGDESNFKLFYYPFYFCSIISIILAIFNQGNALNNFFKEVLRYTAGWAILTLPICLSTYYIFTRKEKKQKLTVLIIIFGSWSIPISIFLGVLKYENIKKDHLGNSIIYKDVQINSTKKYFYIGHTKNYIFYYNDSLEVTDVFPASLVSKISVK